MPSEWPWSSYRATAGVVNLPSFLTPNVLWEQLGGRTVSAAMRRFRDFVVSEDGRSDTARSLDRLSWVARISWSDSRVGAIGPAAKFHARNDT